MQTRRAAPKKITKTVNAPKKAVNTQPAVGDKNVAETQTVDAVRQELPAVVTETPANTTTAADTTAPVEYKQVFSHISPARVRHYLDKQFMNREINKEYKFMKFEVTALREATAALKDGTTTTVAADGTSATNPLTAEQRLALEAVVARVTPFEREYVFKMDALSRERERFSSCAPATLSIVCDELIKQLVCHAIDSAIGEGKKIIQNYHVHMEGVEKLSLYKLVKDLPSFEHNAEQYASSLEKLKVSKLYKTARNESWKEFRSRYNQALSRKKKSPAMVLPIKTPEAAAVEVAEPAEELLEDNKSSFVFYVVRECKAIIGESKQYKGIRVSTEIKKYLSDLLIEFIEGVSEQVYLSTNNMSRKTVNSNAILLCVQKTMISGHKPVVSITYEPAEVSDPFKKAEELANKAAAEKLGTPYTVDGTKIPKVTGLSAKKTVDYPTSGYNELHKLVDARMKLYVESDLKTPATEAQ